MIINWWGDFTCPYSYIGSSNLKRAAKNLGIDAEFIMHAYELHPDMPDDEYISTETALIQDDGMTPAQAKQQIMAVDAYAKQSDLPMNFAGEHFCNTLDAHRLVSWAQTIDKALASDLVDALYYANFAENQILTDEDVLLSCVKKAGLDVGEAEKVLNSDAFTNMVRADEEEAERIGFESIPYFRIDETVLDSSKPLDECEKILKEVLEKETNHGEPKAHTAKQMQPE